MIVRPRISPPKWLVIVYLLFTDKSEGNHMRAIGLALRSTWKLFGSHRKLWLPFLITALFEALLVVSIWLAPHPPFAKFLAPPIRYFFGDRVLHYPWHLWFMYHAMRYTHLVAATLAGAFFTGIACAMVQQAHQNAPISLREALVGKKVSYGRAVVLWLIAWGVANGVMKTLAMSLKEPQLLLWGNVAALLVLQALFVYTIPASVFDKLPWWKALFRGLRETVRHPFSTLIVIAIPSAVAIAFSTTMPSGRVLQWMMRLTPELAIPLAVARLFVWVVVDAWMTISIANLWWFHRTAQQVHASSASPAIPKHIEQTHAIA